MFNLKRVMSVDAAGLKYGFCPGKATWYVDIYNLYYQCRIALETGILPHEGSLQDQDETFCEVFPLFVDRWKERTYGRVWEDTRQYVEAVLKAVLGTKK